MTNTIKDKIITFMILKKSLENKGISEEDAGVEALKYLSNFRENNGL